MEEDGPSAELKRGAQEQNLKAQTSRPTKTARVDNLSSPADNKPKPVQTRPSWQPPILDYTYLAELLEAQKEMMATRRGDFEWQLEL